MDPRLSWAMSEFALFVTLPSKHMGPVKFLKGPNSLTQSLCTPGAYISTHVAVCRFLRPMICIGISSGLYNISLQPSKGTQHVENPSIPNPKPLQGILDWYELVPSCAHECHRAGHLLLKGSGVGFGV